MRIVLTAKPRVRGRYTANPTPADLQAIGEFITACSILEIEIHNILRALLRVDEHVARILVGERRVGDLVQLLRFGFFERSPLQFEEDDKNAIDALLQRVHYVNDVRAIVAHKPCSADDRSLEFHNQATAAKKSREFRYVCTAAQLSLCADHALHLASHLGAALSLDARPYFAKRVRALLASADKADLPDPPSSTSPKTPRTPRKPRPPRSSRQ